jgi:thymidylate synthase ThyX
MKRVLNAGYVRLEMDGTELQQLRNDKILVRIKCPLALAAWFMPMWIEKALIGEFYVPGTYTSFNSDKKLTDAEQNEFNTKFTNYVQWAQNFVTKLQEKGLSYAQAELLLPQAMYVEIVWEPDLDSMLTSIELFMQSDQFEVKAYGRALIDELAGRLPHTTRMFLAQKFPQGL